MQVFIAANKVNQIAAVHDVLRRTGGSRRFLNTKTIRVICKGDLFAALLHSPDLPPLCPFVLPSAIRQRIANLIISNVYAIERRQLILPVRIRIGERVALDSRTDAAGRVRIRRFLLNIAAMVIGKHPRRTRSASRRIIRVVHPNQLPQQVIHIGNFLLTVADARDIARFIICIGQFSPRLRHRANERRRAVAAICTIQIGVRRCHSRSACICAAFTYSAESIISIRHRLVVPERHQRRTVFFIVRKSGCVFFSVLSDLFLEGLYIIIRIIDQFARIRMLVAFKHCLSARTIGSIVFTQHRNVARAILHSCNFAVCAVGILEAVIRIVIIAHTNNALKVIICVAYLSTVAIGDAFRHAIRLISRFDQRLCANLHGFKPSDCIICKRIGNIFRSIIGRIVFHLRQLILGIRKRIGVFAPVCRRRSLRHPAITIISIVQHLSAGIRN